MICKNCGREINESVTYCPGCGIYLDQQGNAPHPTPSADPYFGGVPERYETPERLEIPRDKASSGFGIKVALIAVIATVLIVMACLIFAFMPSMGGGGELSLNLDNYPSSTKATYYELTGDASSPKYNATITINGEFVANISGNASEQKWSKEVSLKRGDNTFLVTIVNSEGESITETVEILCNQSVTYEKGTILVKKNSSGVYIRPTPQISDKFVLLINQNDYKSQFVCTGEETTDSEGYLWCKVQTPANGLGWVRTDLMRVLE